MGAVRDAARVAQRGDEKEKPFLCGAPRKTDEGAGSVSIAILQQYLKKIKIKIKMYILLDVIEDVLT